LKTSSSKSTHTTGYRVSVATALALCVSAASAASAPGPEGTEDEALEEVVVTGTLIRGVAPVGSPTIDIDRDALVRAGGATLTDVIATVPQVASIGGNQFNAFAGQSQQNSRISNNFGRATNLRGLGPSATLVLIDGRRPAYPNFFDMSVIPAIAVARVDIVADGASALYGSDAVAGVVNVGLRRDYDGAEFALRYGTAGDYSQGQLAGVFGHAWSSGSVMFAVERNDMDALEVNDLGNLFNDDLREFGSLPPPRQAYPGNIIAGTATYPIPAGQSGANLLLGQLQAGTPRYRSYFADADAAPEMQSDSVVLTLTQDLGERIRLDLSGHWFKRDFDQRRTSSVSSGAGLSVPSSNPFSPCNPARSPAGNPGLNCAANLSVLYAFANDLGLQRYRGSTTNQSIGAAATFDLWSDWKLTASAGRAENEDSIREDNIANQTAVSIALGNVVGGVSRPTNVPFFNPFCGNAGTCNDAATLDYIRGAVADEIRFTKNQYKLQADGSLFSVPGGEVRLAVGAEYHEDEYSLTNTTSVASRTVATPTVTGGTVGRDITSFFAEAYIPLIGADNARPGIRRLSLSLAGRVEDYSDFGQTSNPKLGISWQPVAGLNVRATYGTSFRAPTLPNIATTFGNRTTPNNLLGTQIGLNDPRTLSVINRGGGRAGLEPETATTFSLGIDTTPELVPGLTASLNYYQIEYEDQLTNPPLVVGFPGAIAASPLYDRYITYNPAFYPSRATLSQAEFNAFVTGLLTATYPPVTAAAPPVALVAAVVDGRVQNAGAIDAQGVDFSVRYTRPADWGDWRLGVSGTYVMNWDVGPVPGAPQVDLANTFSYPLEFVARGELGLARGGIDAALFLNYRNGYDMPRIFLPTGVGAQYQKVSSYTTVDLHLGYAFQAEAGPLAKLSLALDVQNLLDEDPPLVLNGGAFPIRFDPANASPYGRLVTLSLRKAF
jgi:iron complex outermembrane receptor protein